MVKIVTGKEIIYFDVSQEKRISDQTKNARFVPPPYSVISNPYTDFSKRTDIISISDYSKSKLSRFFSVLPGYNPFKEMFPETTSVEYYFSFIRMQGRVKKIKEPDLSRMNKEQQEIYKDYNPDIFDQSTGLTFVDKFCNDMKLHIISIKINHNDGSETYYLGS